MKYLDSTFSVYPAVQRRKRTEASQPPRPGHEFINLSGICGACGLDRIGHDRRYNLKHADKRGTDRGKHRG